VTSNNGYIGNSNGSIGTVTVDGAGSSFALSGSLTVGNAGIGTLSIANGGTVSSSNGFIGYATRRHRHGYDRRHQQHMDIVWRPVGGRLWRRHALRHQRWRCHRATSAASGIWLAALARSTVTGAGSKWTTISDLVVGNAGTGTLAIASAAAVTGTSAPSGTSLKAAAR